MKIYVGHLKKGFDFKTELYEPIRNSRLNNQYEIVLPHEKSDKPFSSKDFFKNECGIMIAEVSFPATGIGMEIAYADIYQVPIICIYKKGTKPAGSLSTVTKRFLEYSNSNELIDGLERMINEVNAEKEIN